MMTRKQFEVAAVRDAERRLGVPAGWWGKWCEIHAPGGISIRFAPRSADWIVRRIDHVSHHVNRAAAIAKAKRLLEESGTRRG